MLAQEIEDKEHHLKVAELDFCKPFFLAAKDLLVCKALLQHGEIYIEVSLPEIELVPNGIMGLAPGKKVGDYDVSFALTPMLSKSDLAQVRDFEHLRISKVKSKQDLRTPFRAHLKTQNHWYGIVDPLYFPARIASRLQTPPLVAAVAELGSFVATVAGAA